MIKEVPRPARQSPERAFSCALLFYGHAGSAVQECPSVERSVGNDAENVGGDAITARCITLDGSFGVTCPGGRVGSEAVGGGAFANLANPRMLVFPVPGLRMQCLVDLLAPLRE